MEALEQPLLLVAVIGMAAGAVKFTWDLRGKRAAKICRGRAKDSPGESVASFRRSAEIMIPALALLFLTVSITVRSLAAGHGPFSNMYEFTLAFSWGVLAATVYFQWRYRTSLLTVVGTWIALSLMIFALTLPSRQMPLVPALQQGLLLSFHVATAVIAYGTFAVGFGAGVLYLLRGWRQYSFLPTQDMLDQIGYQSVKIGFPFMTLVIALGALWADIAWGRYWGWDPKETASLVTWLIYAGYLHARIIRGWRGYRSTILLLIGFTAVLFTFLGNYIFSGLHSYQ